MLLEAHKIVDALNKTNVMGKKKRSIDGSVDLTPVVREESHCHQADQPCLLGLLFTLLTLFYYLCVYVCMHTLMHCEHTHMPQHTRGSGRETEWSWFSFLGPGTRLWLPGLQGGRARAGSLRCLTDPPLLLCVLFSTFFNWATAAPWLPAKLVPTLLILHPSQGFCRGMQAPCAPPCSGSFYLLFGASAVSFPPVLHSSSLKHLAFYPIFPKHSTLNSQKQQFSSKV